MAVTKLPADGPGRGRGAGEVAPDLRAEEAHLPLGAEALVELKVARRASSMGRLNATWPFATLELTGAALKLAIVPGRLFGVKTMSAGPLPSRSRSRSAAGSGPSVSLSDPRPFPTLTSGHTDKRRSSLLWQRPASPSRGRSSALGPGDTAPVTARNGWAGVLAPQIPPS